MGMGMGLLDDLIGRILINFDLGYLVMVMDENYKK